MKDFLAKFIMTLVIAGIFLLLCFFGVIVLGNNNYVDNSISQQNIVTNLSGENTIEDDLDIDNEYNEDEEDEEDFSQYKEDLSNNTNTTSSTTSLSTSTSYTNLYIDEYYYNQLDSDGKNIYKALKYNEENMKSGTYKLELGDIFTTTLTKTTGSASFKDSFQSAIEAYIYDNPQIFYLEVNKMNLSIEKVTVGTKVTYNVYLDQGDNETYLSDSFSSSSQLETAISKLEDVRDDLVSQKMSSPEYNIKLVHDYLIDNVSYEQTISQNNIYNIYGALVSKECVCEGYAKAMKYILDAMDIECIFVFGDATNSSNKSESHAWNYVKIDYSWYGVDVTWDDPIISGGGTITDESKYKYFLKGSQVFGVDHFPDGSSSTRDLIFTYPTLSTTDY